jgi:ubiquinone/menaquinone biosynthesis C-methylase UbiE
MDEQELKELFKNTFNTVAEGYDSSAMRFFPESAKQMSAYLDLNGNEHVLDVATGTGNVGLAIAKDLPFGKVTGIDFSEGMLSQANRKKEERGIGNVSFTEMDMQALDFPDNHFDAAISAFSIFFVEDMVKLVAHIADKVKSEGEIIASTFYDDAFSPLVTLFLNRLKRYGVEVPTLAWKRVSTKGQCESLFKEAGLHNVKSEQIECGYYLNSAADWWYIIWNGGFRGLVNQLSSPDLEKFRREHFAEVQELRTDKGIWLEMTIIYTIGTKKI